MTASLVAGVLTGLIYGLLAIGLVLVFKAARFVNLAHAQLGVLGALFLAKFVLDFGWSYWLAFPVGVASGVAVGWLAELVLIRRLRVANRFSSLLLTLGVAQILLALTYVKALSPNPTQLYGHGYPVPFHTSWEIGGFVLGGQDVLTLLLVPAIGLGLAAFLAWTRTGLAIRALASNPDEARLCGIAPGRLRAMVWAIAGGLSAVTAILQAPGQGTFNLAALGPGLLLRALGAAAVGGFTSLSVAMAGGLVLGVIEHVALHVSGNGGVSELVVFAAIVFALLVRSRARHLPSFAEDHFVVDAPPARLGPSAAGQPSKRYERLWVGLAGVLMSLSLPFWPFFQPESKRFLLAIMAAFALLAISLTVLLGWAGQMSLGHFALLGIGAYMTAHLEPHGWSMPLLLVASGVVGAAVMVVVGWPAIRLRGLTLAVTTLGFAVLAPQWLYVQSWFGSTGTVTARPPGLVGLGRPTS